MQEEKKQKAADSNPSLKVFMGQMNQMNKAEKKANRDNAVNPMIKNNQVRDTTQIAKSGAGSVPPEASKVHDNESNSKLVNDLQKQLKQLFFENKQVSKEVQKTEKLKNSAQAKLEKIMLDRNLIKINGKMEAKTEI